MSAPQTPSTIKFIQAQAFVLAGSGSSIGDVTLTLQSMYGIDGQPILTADLGSFAYGTLEPGNGVQEEAILFTGVTQNSNGTATLTGVSSIGFKDPYNVTSGLQKTHAGNSKFILSNDAAFYNNFTLYLNAIAGAGAANASTTVKGIVQAATTAQVNASTPTGSTGAVLAVTPDVLGASTNNQYVAGIRDTGIPYGVATGTPSAYSVTLASSISTLASGTYLNFLVPITNATGITLNVNSLGAKTIKNNFNASLASGDVITGQIATVTYNGTNFQLANPVPNAYSSGLTTKNLADANTAQVFAHGLSVTPKKVAFDYNLDNGAETGTGSGVYDTSGQRAIYQLPGGTSTTSIQALTISTNASFTAGQVGTVTVDATNITITWVKSGSPSGTANILWSAEA